MSNKDGIIAKLEWAEKHIYDLKAFWDAFRVSAYPVHFYDTEDGEYRVFYLGNVAPIPVDVPLLIGDAVHNIRCALDQLIYRACDIFTNGAGPYDALYFPIAKDAATFPQQLTKASTKEVKTPTKRVVQRLSDKVIENLELLEPYAGGSGEILYYINKLDIIDKHHLLIVASSQNRMRSMSPSAVANIRSNFLGVANIPTRHDSKLFLTEGKTVFDLKTGDILDGIPMAEVQQDMQFPIEVAFREPEIVKGKPVIETLHHAVHLARSVFNTFNNEGLLD